MMQFVKQMVKIYKIVIFKMPKVNMLINYLEQQDKMIINLNQFKIE